MLAVVRQDVCRESSIRIVFCIERVCLSIWFYGHYSTYFRPVEVDYLKSNSLKAKKLLKWSPKISLDDLIDEMIKHELEVL